MFWGLTPCLDLLEDLKCEEDQEINILLIGSSDARHVIKTISRAYRKEKVRINFYIMEEVPEVIAKQLFLLNIAFQPVKELGLVQKTRIFMDLFGNSLVRPVSAKYLTSLAVELIKMITNYEYLKENMPFLTMDLKYKERDYIENVFKFWTGIDEFDILNCWDRRLRKSLGVRYDARKGVFDWDLHMRLHNVGGQTVCSEEYLSFRLNGIAFSWLESEVSKPNRSMVTGLIPNGDHFGHYGYLGEMVTGPFIAYGVQCEDGEYLKKQNHANKYRSTDITERNLREIFHEIEFRSKYVHTRTSEIALGACKMQLAEAKVVDNFNTSITRVRNKKCMDLENITINFISIKCLNAMQYKDKYKNFFNTIYFSCYLLKHFNKNVVEFISAPGCNLIFENQIFILHYRDADLEKYFDDIKGRISELDSYACPFDVKKDFYTRFIMK